MLYELVNGNRDIIVSRVRARAKARGCAHEAQCDLSTGVAVFLSQLSDLLFLRHADPSSPGFERRVEMARAAANHGESLRRHGFTLAQVVRDYTEIGRTIVELAAEHELALDPHDMVTISLCVDAAVTGAVTQHARQRQADDAARLEALARELRNTVDRAGALGSDPMREKLQHIRDSLDAAIEQLDASRGARGGVAFELDERLASLPPSAAPSPHEWKRGPAGNLTQGTR